MLIFQCKGLQLPSSVRQVVPIEAKCAFCLCYSEPEPLLTGLLCVCIKILWKYSFKFGVLRVRGWNNSKNIKDMYLIAFHLWNTVRAYVLQWVNCHRWVTEDALLIWQFPGMPNFWGFVFCAALLSWCRQRAAGMQKLPRCCCRDFSEINVLPKFTVLLLVFLGWLIHLYLMYLIKNAGLCISSDLSSCSHSFQVEQG